MKYYTIIDTESISDVERESVLYVGAAFALRCINEEEFVIKRLAGSRHTISLPNKHTRRLSSIFGQCLMDNKI